jgi:hypothetical protein
VSIASVPSGASVTINGQDRGKTPVAVELPRKDKHLLKIELPGYLPFESYLIRRVSGWVWGNLVFGGIPGLAIDAITGGLYNLKPEEVTATLTAAWPVPVSPTRLREGVPERWSARDPGPARAALMAQRDERLYLADIPGSSERTSRASTAETSGTSTRMTP